MPNFPQSLGSLPSGGKPRTFNPSQLKRSGEESSTEKQYAKATTDEQKKILYQKALAEYNREKAIDRMLIL